MKKAIEIIRNNNIVVDDFGFILSELPGGEAGLLLVDEIENETMTDYGCYIINNDRLQFQSF
ncbi:MAG: hypothetical protein V4560_14985 [Bacteroidota bacterium]